MPDFDPYYEWLGIPPKDQPAHHYRLLGLELYEDHRTAIDAAGNRLMAYLQELSNGEDAEMAQQILNEVSTARICLLTKKRKATYDRALKAKLKKKSQKSKSQRVPTPPPIPTTAPPKKQSAPPPIPAQNVQPAAIVAPQIISEPVSTRSPSPAAQRTVRRPRQSEKTILFVVIAVLLVLAVGLGLYYVVSSQNWSIFGTSTSPDSRNEENSAEDSVSPKKPGSLSESDLIGEAREVAWQAAQQEKTKLGEDNIAEVPVIVDRLIRPHWLKLAQQDRPQRLEFYQLAAKHAINLCLAGQTWTIHEQRFQQQAMRGKNPRLSREAREQLERDTRNSYRQKYGKIFEEEFARMLSGGKK